MGKYLDPKSNEALSLAEEAAYTPAELESYDSYWKAVSSERTLLKEVVLKEKIETAKRMKSDGLTATMIAKYTELTLDEIDKL